MEKLSQIIMCRVNNKDWKGIQLSRGGPYISHVFFADDLILFSEANHAQAHVLKECLEVFCQIFGQRVNLEKSAIYCSANLNHCVAKDIAGIIGSPMVSNLDTYLGVPIIHSKTSKRTYNHFLEKMKLKLATWKGQHLSLAGRSVLVKVVLSSLPVYTMNTVKLPTSICKNVDKIARLSLVGSS